MGGNNKRKFEEITSRRNEKGKGNKKKLFLFRSKAFITFILFLIFILIGVSAGIFLAIINTTKELNVEDLRFNGLTTIFYDKGGKPIGSIFGSENRTAVSLTDMSKYLPDAFIAIEDERFRDHNGIDLKRTMGAVINYIIPGGKSYGGSTITQQLIKNATGDKEVSLRRKIQEQWNALTLEKKLSKDQILELYLNTIYLSQGAYGVEAAAKTYFNKKAKDLTLSESAIIAGITNYPSKYDPIKNFNASKERQELILSKMKEIGSITQDEYDSAVKEKLVFKEGSKNKAARRQSYFIDAVCEDVLKDLREQRNIDEDTAEKILYSDGLKIYTTMDTDVQSALEKAYADNSSVFSRFKGSDLKPQSATVVIDYSNGWIVGVVGGRGEKEGVRTYNRATQARRQPGSTIKPIAVYAPALEDKLITPATIIDDVPITIGLWSPRNWYKDGFWGLSTVRRGLEQSMNVVAVKVWLKVGGERSYDFMKELGVSSLSREDKNSPAALALGGLTKGITPLEMAAAYGTIANGGYYIKPVTYTKVMDGNGRVLLENRKQAGRVMDERVAYLLTSMLQDVVSSGTGTTAKLSNIPVAGKTGTTSSNMDRWFVGYTPYYVGATWFGYDKNHKIPYNTNFSAQLWKMVMEQVHKNKDRKNFVEPEGLIRREICIDSGQLAGDLCKHDLRGDRTRTELFIKGTEPEEVCSTHVKVNVCKDSGLLATDGCPSGSVKSKIMIVRPEPYVPADLDAPKPTDKKYEAPVGEYCNIH